MLRSSRRKPGSFSWSNSQGGGLSGLTVVVDCFSLMRTAWTVTYRLKFPNQSPIFGWRRLPARHFHERGPTLEKPRRPANETLRLKSLNRLNVLDTPAEDRFDRITRLARKTFSVPIALVSLVDEGRQWFKSCLGLNVRETSREISFCGHTILDDKPLVVTDATNDIRFHDNPLVTDDPSIRFYAGFPVSSPDGNKMGTLCIIDRKPRELSEEDISILSDLAKMVEDEFRVARLSQSQQQLVRELDNDQRKACIDSLSLCWNRRGILEVAEKELSRLRVMGQPFGVAIIDIDNFKGINEAHGHPVGDEVLRVIAARLRGALRPSDAVGRYGERGFLAVVPNAKQEELSAVAERLRKAIECRKASVLGDLKLSVTAGVGTSWGNSRSSSLDSFVSHAEQALCEAKKTGGNRVYACDFDPNLAVGVGS